MIKKILKPFRRLSGIEQYDKLYNQYSQLMEEHSKATILIANLESKITMQSESLRKAAERIIELEKSKADLSLENYSMNIASDNYEKRIAELEEIEGQLKSMLNTKPYKVWITRDSKKNIKHPNVELWIKKPQLKFWGMYSGYRIVSIPETTFKRHNGFVPKKGEIIQGAMWLEVKR